MKNRVKLIVVSSFGLFGLLIFLGSVGHSSAGSALTGGIWPTPTPSNVNTVVKSNTAVNANAANTAVTPKANAATPSGTTPSGKEMREKFTLGQDSQSEYGAVPFNHKTHAFMSYSPDGKSVVGCAECHHTDQPKSALKLPLVTSERDVTLTFDVWKGSSQKVGECRACHFQSGAEPEGKTMPTATYTEKGKTVTKDLNNELAYHINCNVCHDNAAKLRPELKKKPGFATGADCALCHSGGN